MIDSYTGFDTKTDKILIVRLLLTIKKLNMKF